MRPIIFLDIDGVLNSTSFYIERKKRHDAQKQSEVAQVENVREKLKMQGLLPSTPEEKFKRELEHFKDEICPVLLQRFNTLCTEIDAKVVISSTWRLGRTLEELRIMFQEVGGTFEIIDKTGKQGLNRGSDIQQWIDENINKETYGVDSFDFINYAIIDDDSDMLLRQRENFFQTDTQHGLSHNVVYRIIRFFKIRKLNFG